MDKLSDILDIIDAAATLNVSRKAISAIVNERKAVTPEMALRLSRAFDTTPDLWLNLQKNTNYGALRISPKDGRMFNNCTELLLLLESDIMDSPDTTGQRIKTGKEDDKFNYARRQ
ncbi:MAG: HigA family addiction module antidote protein [Desulfamplus sp.]|nr:HigA family addiction module antidote protein [Desulfamplus sp.]